AAGFVVRRLTGIPYSFTAHGSDLHVDRHMLREKVDEAAFVVAISEFNRNVILRECGEDVAGKLVVVHCGVDTQLFRQRDTTPPDRPFTVICVGTLQEVKGQAHLIEACRLLAGEGIDVTCMLIGKGKDRSVLERRIAEAGLEGRVSLAGSLKRADVAEVLRSAHVLVAPSVATKRGKREGIPVALMEAMSGGVAVVASDLSGIPELVEHEATGLLVPPRDSTALAGALRRLHDDPALRERLALAGREKVEREFDVRASAAELVRRFRAHAEVAA
ncbi:MAG: glycosyltransferase, partial [Candidatus Limnocylindria bacterium]